MLLAGAASAQANTPEQDQLDAYVEARVADSMGEASIALRGYHAALASAPGNRIIAENALEQALAAGDRVLAVKAARILEGAGAATPEVRFVLLAEAVRSGAWPVAELQVAELSRDDAFSFMAPVLGAWIALESRGGDPIALLAKGAADPIGGSYAAEHRVLLLLALGQDKEGMIALRGRVEAQDIRAMRLMIAGAARLARQGKRREALALLEGNARAIADARNWLQKRGKLPGEISTPAQGIAEFFLRLSVDLQRQNVESLALSFARLSTFLAPEHSETWLVTSALLGEQDRNREALAVLRNIAPDDPAAAQTNDAMVRLMAETGEQEGALAQAQKAATARDATSGDWIRLGDLYNQIGRNGEAADAYGQALQAASDASVTRPQWALWLLKGGAHEQADQWPEAKAALETAYKLAPQEPMVLNYLGYSQLERRENIGEAEKLIREARRLRPENAQITDSLGWARFLQGDLREATSLLERAVRGEPTDAAINEHLGDVYYSSGRRFEARHAWHAALITASDEDAARLRAKIDRGLTPETASP